MSNDSNTAEIHDDLLDRMYEMDLEPFKHLCKIVIDTVETPSQIEVAQNRSFGPHIHGEVGKKLLAAEFGVHVFQHESEVPEATIGEISSRFEDTGCQFGALITLSEFGEGAVKRAKELDGISVRLISGSDLIYTMIGENIGVSKDEESYYLDHSFWDQFEKFGSGLIPSRKIPQADSLELLTPTLRAIYRDHRKFSEMAEYLRENSSDHITERQTHYYVTAAELVGLAKPIYDPHGQSTIHGWELTSSGEQYLLNSNNRDDFIDIDYLRDAIEQLEIVKEIEKKFDEKPRLDHTDLVEVIKEKSAVTGTTAERRATCLGKWFWTIQGDIKRRDRSKRVYEYYPDGAMGSYFNS